jgi:V-type H+-transporting ATPase subunit A
LSEIFDGIQRPLNKIAEKSESVFVPRGVDVPPLNLSKTWEFKPNPSVKVGSLLGAGDIYGTVFENDLFDTHCLMVHPRAKGRVTYIAPPANYTIN